MIREAMRCDAIVSLGSVEAAKPVSIVIASFGVGPGLATDVEITSLGDDSI